MGMFYAGVGGNGSSSFLRPMNIRRSERFTCEWVRQQTGDFGISLSVGKIKIPSEQY